MVNLKEVLEFIHNSDQSEINQIKYGGCYS